MRNIGLANPFGAPVFYEKVVSSTMDRARALTPEEGPHGTAVMADVQEAGRGRGNRKWRSNAGENLLCTILLRYERFEAVPQGITLRIGLAAALAAEGFLPPASPPVRIKWPNDIMIGPCKAAGILCEGEGGTVRAGIGVNINQTVFPEGLREKATSMALAGKTVFPDSARFALLENILGRIHRELSEEEGAWQERLLPRLYMQGRKVRFIPGAAGAAGGITGRLEGIGPQGEICILPEGGTQAALYSAGELDLSWEG
ncbi:MAG: biotin--[acetyl-CoA-carboxylase] ligase [Spirochaetaceae bacterium]|jgi:BirA family biotin operon repressor/biotin-[acetyl-CoA-carboxylase] ligase|nr:biotin--[acetyl-CoA-carboxylase] ligase [Spirochaetaceae bacterium]